MSIETLVSEKICRLLKKYGGLGKDLTLLCEEGAMEPEDAADYKFVQDALTV